jgi:hypothetical protein
MGDDGPAAGNGLAAGVGDDGPAAGDGADGPSLSAARGGNEEQPREGAGLPGDATAS